MPDGDKETVIFVDEIVGIILGALPRVEVWTNHPGMAVATSEFVYDTIQDAAEAASEIRKVWEEWMEKSVV